MDRACGKIRGRAGHLPIVVALLLALASTCCPPLAGAQEACQPTGSKPLPMLVPAVPAMWASLARHHVLVSVAAVGAERVAGRFQGRVGWVEAFLLLHEATKDDDGLLGRIHELVIRKADQPGVRVWPRNPLTDPVLLQVDFALRAEPIEGGAVRLVLALPDAAAIHAVLAGLGERPTLAKYDFDERFPLFLASLGLGVELLQPDLRAPAGGYAFQEALKAYGDMIGAQPPTPFAHLREGLTREVDPCVNPQALLQQGLETDAGLEVPRDASFPGDAARPRRFYIAFAIKGGSVAVYSLDDMDGAFARLAEHDAAAATAATAATGPDPTAAAGSNAPARRRPSWSCRTP